MVIAFNLLLTLIVELSIIALFFRRRKRKKILLTAFLINIVSWSIAHIIFFSTDINMNYVAVGLAICEAIAFHIFLECNWQRAIIISLVANSFSFFATEFIPADLFQSKPEIIKRAY